MWEVDEGRRGGRRSQGSKGSTKEERRARRDGRSLTLAAFENAEMVPREVERGWRCQDKS